MRHIGLISLALLMAGSIIAAEKPTFEELLLQADTAADSGKTKEALSLLTRAIVVEPENPRGYFARARVYEVAGESTNAVADYDEVLKREPSRAQAWQSRGTEHFKLGHIKEAIADFDRFLALVPQQTPHHWQRGIAYYYAGRYADGRKQFELHQTVNSNDVENAVWHFLCVARESNVEKARAALIPIKADARIPMMQIHSLFAGKATPEDVLKTAIANSKVPPGWLKRQQFYAHLYVGLYFEAIGDEKRAREHISLAAGEIRVNDYMGDVARVHKQLRWPEAKAASEPSAKN